MTVKDNISGVQKCFFFSSFPKMSTEPKGVFITILLEEKETLISEDVIVLMGRWVSEV